MKPLRMKHIKRSRWAHRQAIEALQAYLSADDADDWEELLRLAWRAVESHPAPAPAKTNPHEPRAAYVGCRRRPSR